MGDEIVIPTDDASKERARRALDNTDDTSEEAYLEAVLTVMDYHRDPTFDTDLF